MRGKELMGKFQLVNLTVGDKNTILLVWLLYLFFAFATEWASVTSDSVEVSHTSQGIISHLWGNVVVTIEETVINGSEATVYEAEQKAMILNVIASDKEILLRGDTMIYYRPDDKVVMKGKVKLKTPDEIIYADTLIYLRKVKKLRGKGDVRVVSLKDDILVTGGEGEYDLRKDFGKLTDSPVFIIKAREDTKVESESMSIDHRAHMASAVGNVNLSMRSANVGCDSLRYDLENETACMWGNPKIEGKSGWVSGDTIRVFFEDREVTKTSVIGDASGEYGLRGGTNFVRGDTIEIFFDQGEMESILVKGSAEGEYIEGTED